jgi:hypothetical protein
MELTNPLLMNILAITAMVSGLLIAAWYIVGLYWVFDRKVEEELPEVELPGHIHEVFTGTPPVLILFYVFMVIAMALYVTYIWAGGISF